MKTPRYTLPGIVLAIVLATFLYGIPYVRGWMDQRRAQSVVSGSAPARIFPDYSGTVIPPNIAPMNFRIAEAGVRSVVWARGGQGRPVVAGGRWPDAVFPETAWKRLLEANKGSQIWFDIAVKTADGQWQRYAAITNRIAAEPVDSHLVYRKIHPAHNTWTSMGIYQRDLQSFRESPVLENKRFGNDCCHCHSLCNNNPANASLDIRSSKLGNSLLIVSNQTALKASGTVGFTSWHPGGRILACSFNKPRLMLHGLKNDMRDIVELDGWLGYFSLPDTHVKRIPSLSDEHFIFTFPCWSPDGRHLYYCSSPNPWIIPGKTRNNNYAEVKFDLMRIAYDAVQDRWGKPETIVAVRDTGLSVVQPRVSPDGRWLTFGMCDYGCWATYHPESDLYIVDLKADRPFGKYACRKLEINSAECESWHGWSSNGRWLVFSSKRGNPLFSRPYLAYAGENGSFQKPFLVPQRDPSFYDSYLKTYTIPTFSTGPFQVSERDLAKAVKSSKPHPLVMPPRTQAAAAADEASRLDPNANDEGKQQ